MTVDYLKVEGILGATPTPIAELSPRYADAPLCVIDGVITITWPFSASRHSVAFILAEHDFRHRRARGQVRLEFHGAAGEAINSANVGGGDEVRLSLEGVKWEEKDVPIGITGDPLRWQLSFDQTLCLILKRFGTSTTETLNVNSQGDAQQVFSVGENSVSEMSVKTVEPSDHATIAPRTPLLSAAIKRPAASAFDNLEEFISPAFLKRARVSYGSLFEGGFEQLERETERTSKRKAKARFSFPAAAWKYNSRSPSPSDQSSTSDDGRAHNADNQSSIELGAELDRSQSSVAHGDLQNTLARFQQPLVASTTDTPPGDLSAILPVSQDPLLPPPDVGSEPPTTIAISLNESSQANTSHSPLDEYMHAPLPPEHDAHLFDFDLAERHHSDHSPMLPQVYNVSRLAQTSSLETTFAVSNESETHTHSLDPEEALAHDEIGKDDAYHYAFAQQHTAQSTSLTRREDNLPTEERMPRPLISATDSAAPIEILSSSPPQSPACNPSAPVEVDADAHLEEEVESDPATKESSLASSQTGHDDETPFLESENESAPSAGHASEEFAGEEYDMQNYDMTEDEGEIGDAGRDSLSSEIEIQDLGTIDRISSIAGHDDQDGEVPLNADRGLSQSHENMQSSSNEIVEQEPELNGSEDSEEEFLEEEDVGENVAEDSEDDFNEDEFLEVRPGSDSDGEISESGSEDVGMEENSEGIDQGDESGNQTRAPVFIDLLSDSEDEKEAPQKYAEEAREIEHYVTQPPESDETDGSESKLPVSCLPLPPYPGISDGGHPGELPPHINGAGNQDPPIASSVIVPAVQIEASMASASPEFSPIPVPSPMIAKLEVGAEGGHASDGATEISPWTRSGNLSPISRPEFENKGTAADIDQSEQLPDEADQLDSKRSSDITASGVLSPPHVGHTSTPPVDTATHVSERTSFGDIETLGSSPGDLERLLTQKPSPSRTMPSSTVETATKSLGQQLACSKEAQETMTQNIVMERSPSPSEQLLDEMQQQERGSRNQATDDKEQAAVMSTGEGTAGRGLRSSRKMAPKQDILITVESLRSHDYMKRPGPDSQDMNHHGTISASNLATTASESKLQQSDSLQDSQNTNVGAGQTPNEKTESPERLETQTSTRVLRRKAEKIDNNPRLPDASMRSTPRLPQQSFRSGEILADTQTHDSLESDDTVTAQATPIPSKFSTALGPSQDVGETRPKMLKMLRSSLPEYLSLKTLRNSLNRTVDVMGIAASTPRSPYRPKSGPRDYLLEVIITDPSSAPSGVSVAQIYRPHQKSLPIVQIGDVVLLRRFQVLSMKGRGFGVRAGDESGWAIFEKTDEEMLPQINGPPLELSAEEISYATSLREWWANLEDDAVQKIAKAVSKATHAGKGNTS